MHAEVLPNPSSGTSLLRVEMPKAAKLHLRIADLSGRIVVDRQLGTMASGEHFLPIENLSSGVYMVNLSSENTNRSIKLVVSR